MGRIAILALHIKLITLMILAFQIVTALLLDHLLGEPRRFHPLVGFGRLAARVESIFHFGEPRFDNPVRAWLLRLSGLFAWMVLVASFVWLTWFIPQHRFLTFITGSMILYFCIGANSLTRHARNIETALQNNDLQLARQRVARIVSRDTQNMERPAILRATIESVLENGSDAIFAALFWFAMFGIPGVVLYRLANTLDAMWGYKNSRYHYFGWAAARMDDVLNYLPARLTGLSYALVGHTRSALRCWALQARHWAGFNPGIVMASGAGALQIRLGGSACYHGKTEQRIELGCDEQPELKDIARALQLVHRSVWLWVIVITGINIIAYTWW